MTEEKIGECLEFDIFKREDDSLYRFENEDGRSAGIREVNGYWRIRVMESHGRPVTQREFESKGRAYRELKDELKRG